ncbi:class E sortase [Kribbella albertanoniae]|uniref:Class E sortase n=1 Tax=Kribbella albertanoniae TaxID=1266829 RepID=A0A4R4P8L7_9ACTN|nr:class E sortase [Kribbella albertanoniae]
MAGVVVMVLVALAGCSDTPSSTPQTDVPSTSTTPEPEPSATPTPTATPTPSARPTPTPRPPVTGPVTMSIPSIGVRGLRVVTYTGTADDRPGTVIQDRGVAASPRGPAGGVGVGEIGNFIITGHRVSHGRPLERVPELKNGAHVLFTAGGTVYDYVVSQTMTISFRKPAEKAAQNAAVPGRPGVKPTQAMLTISTCATPEDNAAGNYWRDSLGNPEHRINKIARLVATRPA